MSASDGYAGGAPVNHAANGGSVGFTKIGDGEEISEVLPDV
jgi:hypothetical protein